MKKNVSSLNLYDLRFGSALRWYNIFPILLLSRLHWLCAFLSCHFFCSLFLFVVIPSSYCVNWCKVKTVYTNNGTKRQNTFCNDDWSRPRNEVNARIYRANDGAMEILVTTTTTTTTSTTKMRTTFIVTMCTVYLCTMYILRGCYVVW